MFFELLRREWFVIEDTIQVLETILIESESFCRAPNVNLTLIKVLETILKELRDPDRNMHNFDPGDILNKSPLKNLF